MKIDSKQIKTALPMEKLLVHYGAKKTGLNQYWCIWHEQGGRERGHKTPSLVLHPNSQTTSCMSKKCVEGEDIFGVIAKQEGLDIKTDFSKVLEVAARIAGVQIETETPKQARPLKYISLTPEHNRYLQNRGLEQNTILKMGLASSYDHILFLYRDRDGVNGCKARTTIPRHEWDEYQKNNPRWLNYYFKGKGRKIWMVDGIHNKKVIYLVAGEYDASILYQELKRRGLENEIGVVTLTTGEATEIHPNVLKFFAGLENSEWRVIYDFDDTGINSMPLRGGELLGTKKKVSTFAWKDSMNPNKKGGFDINDYFLENKNVDIFLDPQNFNAAIKIATTKPSDSKEKDKNRNQSEMLMDIISGMRDELQFFHNELKEPFVQIVIENRKEIWSCKSKMFKRWLAKIFWDTYQRSINNENLNSTINILESSACFDGDQYTLHNRTAWYDNAIWYDLADPLWRVVKITPDGWQIVTTPPIIFRRYSHQQSQVDPVPEGDLKKLLELVNVQNDDQKILLLVWLVSCFIPDFPHPISGIYGAQGSAKTLLARLLRKLIDPSAIEAATFPKDIKEFVQILAHHSCIFFDNVSYVSNQISDALCKAVTGDGFSKRELYTDEEDIIFSFRRCLGINGINIAARNPDLLERMILFELERVPPEKRRQEHDILDEFEKERPKIIGAIFDAVAKAMQIKPTIKLDALPRMADFVVWSCAIAEALGYTQQQFLDAYYRNIRSQNDEILQDSLIATAVLQFMSERDEWTGTPSQLLKELKVVATNQEVDVEKEKDFPRAANVLSRRLNSLKTNLADEGIKLTTYGKDKKRMICLKRTVKNIVETVESSNEPKNDVDDTFSNF